MPKQALENMIPFENIFYVEPSGIASNTEDVVREFWNIREIIIDGQDFFKPDRSFINIGSPGTIAPLESEGKMVSAKVIFSGEGFGVSHFSGHGGSGNWQRTHSLDVTLGAPIYSYGIAASIIGDLADSFFPDEMDPKIFPIFCRTFQGFSTILLMWGSMHIHYLKLQIRDKTRIHVELQ